jgi:putative ABC transport system substrate-binding protein
MLADPVAAGLVTNLARPGGNVTGVSGQAPSIAGKRLELLQEAVSGVTHVAVLVNPKNPNAASVMRETERAAQTLGIQLQRLAVRTPEELDGAFEAMRNAHAGVLLVLPDPMLEVQRGRIVNFALTHRLPMMSELRGFPEAGGLMSYGTSIRALWRHAATHVDRILRGAKPSDRSIEQATVFEFIINLRTAQALGLAIPPTLLFQADQIIR